ncbi:MAG: 1-acyl-sn-glycerol-3-phosphate acyltransferase [Cyclobacteriaceae bacterium]
MIRQFFILMYKITGWKIKGDRPSVPKYILIVAPHTSYWDFPVGWAAKTILRLKGVFLGKAELFKTPVIGWILKKMGGVPVDRSKNTKLVDFVADLFKRHEELAVVLTPEGTRSYVPKWKTGFYYMALTSEVPIVMVGFDFKHKVVELKEPFYPTGNLEADMDFILDYFRGVAGKYPHLGVR